MLPKTPPYLMVLILLVALLVPAPSSAAPAAVPATAAGPDVKILNTSTTGLVLELTLPPYHLENTSREGATYQQVTVAGDQWTLTAAAGAPQLPERGLLLAVPASGTIDLEVTESQTQALPGTFRIQPAPQLLAPSDSAGDDGSMTWHEDVASYQQDAWLPSAQAEISQEGWLRGQRFVRLALHPVQFNPAQGSLRVATQLQVRLRFSFPNTSSEPLPADPVFDTILQAAFPNYEQAASWRTRPNPLSPPAMAQRLDSGPWVKVTVTSDGLYRLGYADLLSAGVPAATLGNLDPRSLRLLDQDQEQHIYVEGEADGVFDAGDFILFYGQRNRATHSDDANVYWLTWDGADGQRMASTSVQPSSGALAATPLTTVHAEQNNVYKQQRPFSHWMQPIDYDFWYWEQLTHTVTSTVSLGDLPVDTASSASPTVKVYLGGDNASRGSYALQIGVNGQPGGTLHWSNVTILSGTLQVAPQLLVDGANSLSLNIVDLVPNSYNDTAWMDWVEVEYPYSGEYRSDTIFRNPDPGTWRYQVSSVPDANPVILNLATPSQPMRLVNAAATSQSATYQIAWEASTSSSDRYLVVAQADIRQPLAIEPFVESDLLDSGQQVDYLLITPAELAGEAQPLADQRAADGLSVRVVDVQEIYDLFSDGSLSAEAIREYLAYAYSNYQWPPPSYVLLMGDGTIDFRGYKLHRWGHTNLIPPYVGAFDYWSGVGVSDAAFSLLEGDDLLGEVLVGRLPVNNVVEAAEVVSKTLHYATNFPIDRQLNTLWLADNTDSAGNFAQASDQTIALMQPQFQEEDRVTRVYYCDPLRNVCDNSAGTYTNVAAAQGAIVQGLNQAQMFLHFAGHGSMTTWASEQLFRSYWVPSLGENEGLPFMLVSSCDSGYFADFRYDSLDETMVRAHNKGSIGGWAGTTFDTLPSQSVLIGHFMDAVMQDRLTQPAVAAAVAKARTFAQLPYPDSERTVLGHGLTGDPALVLLQPDGNCAVADLDCDGDVDIVDLQLVAAIWESTAWSDPRYNPRADLDHNRRIDLLDIQAAASLWGSSVE